MHSISSAVKPNTTIDSAISLPPGDGRSISSLGAENTFVALRYRKLGELVELVAELTIYHPVGGTWDSEEIGREVTPEQDEAYGIACDLEHAAAKRLRELGVEDYWSDPH